MVLGLTCAEMKDVNRKVQNPGESDLKYLCREESKNVGLTMLLCGCSFVVAGWGVDKRGRLSRWKLQDRRVLSNENK